MEDHNEVIRLGVALVIGLLVGIERGWQERQAGEGERIAGVRTYGLIGLLGGIAAMIATNVGGYVLGFAFGGLAVLLTAAYVVNLRRLEDAGITSLIAALLTFGFGALAVLGHVAPAAAAAVVTTLLLGFKPVLHRWLEQLSQQELRAGIKLLLISVVVLPILPNQGYGPWQALNPYELWWMVVLVAAISFTGYFAMKIAGYEKGVVLTGLFAGLASSTALTLQFARLARKREGKPTLLATGILFACGTMFPRMLLLSSIVNPSLFREVLFPAMLMAVFVYLPGLFFWAQGREEAMQSEANLLNPLELKVALRFGVLLVLIVFLSKGLKEMLGETGLLLLAAASGLTDVDAITLSLSRMSQIDLPLDLAVAGIVVASAVNSVVKAVLAMTIGGKMLGLKVGLPLLVAAMAGTLAVWLR